MKLHKSGLECAAFQPMNDHNKETESPTRWVYIACLGFLGVSLFNTGRVGHSTDESNYWDSFSLCKTQANSATLGANECRTSAAQGDFRKEPFSDSIQSVKRAIMMPITPDLSWHHCPIKTVRQEWRFADIKSSHMFAHENKRCSAAVSS